MNEPKELSVEVQKPAPVPVHPGDSPGVEVLPPTLTLEEIKVALEKKYGHPVAVEKVGEKDGKEVIAVRMGRPVRPLEGIGVGMTKVVGDMLLQDPRHQVGPKTDRGDNAPLRYAAKRVGRNDPCPCESGKKFKHCCASSVRVA